jgi:hypothetical protein
VTNNFSDAHDGHVFRTHDALEAGIDHALTTHAEEVRFAPLCQELLLQRGDEQRAIGFATGFSCGDEDGFGIRHRSAGSRGDENHDNGFTSGGLCRPISLLRKKATISTGRSIFYGLVTAFEVSLVLHRSAVKGQSWSKRIPPSSDVIFRRFVVFCQMQSKEGGLA